MGQKPAQNVSAAPREPRDKTVCARMEAAVRELGPLLAKYAREHGGRFILFGSAARRDMHPDSDVDIIVDFSIEEELEAWLFAEAECFKRGLRPDIQIRAWRADAFVARAEQEGEILG